MKSNPKVLLIRARLKVTEIQNAAWAAVKKTFLTICLSDNQVLSETNKCGSYGNLIAYNAQHLALGTYYGTCRAMKEKVYDNSASQQTRKKGVVEQLTIVSIDTPFYDGKIHCKKRNKKTLSYMHI